MASRIKLIACGALKHEIEAVGPKDIDVVYLDQGLHRVAERLRQELQKEIDRSTNYNCLLLGYGQCSNGTVGLVARDAVLVIPRVDDCISLFMGSRDLYREEFKKAPGTYYLSKGWIDAATDPLKEYYSYKEKYGEETAAWVMKEQLKNYSRVVLIHTDGDPGEKYRRHAREFARFFDLNYEEMVGSLKMLCQLLNGQWSHGFLTIQPGETIQEEFFWD